MPVALKRLIFCWISLPGTFLFLHHPSRPLQHNENRHYSPNEMADTWSSPSSWGLERNFLGGENLVVFCIFFFFWTVRGTFSTEGAKGEEGSGVGEGLDEKREKRKEGGEGGGGDDDHDDEERLDGLPFPRFLFEDFCHNENPRG